MAQIFVIASFSPSLVIFRGKLLEAMVEKGHTVIACSPEITTAVWEVLHGMGIECRDIPLARTGLNPFKDIRSIFFLKKMFLQEKPDYILSYTIKPVIYGSFAARLAGVPHVFSIVTGLGYTFTGYTFKQRILGVLTRILYKFALAFNTKVFFQNPDDCRLFKDLGLVAADGQTAVVNGSGVDLDHYRVVPLPKKVSFLLIARMIAEKGIYEFIEAAKMVKIRHPDTQFVLVGSLDNEPSSIRHQELQLWRDAGLIDYRGVLKDVRPVIEETSVYVLPSYYREGTPRTVLEAMAMGRPVITTDMPGCRETVVDGLNGYLVPVKDDLALSQAMEKFIYNPQLIEEMGRFSRKIAEKKYDVHSVNAKILAEMGMSDSMAV